MARRINKFALFFYTGTLTSENVLAIEKYHATGGYTTEFRKIPNVGYVPKKDIIENNFTLVGGEVPSTYDRFVADATKVVDAHTLAEILSGNVTAPQPSDQTAVAAAPAAANLTPSDAQKISAPAA